MVGTGAEPDGPLSDGARRVVSEVDKVLYLTQDLATERWVRTAGAHAESLSPFLLPGLPVSEAHLDMAEWVLSYLRLGLYVAVLVHGQPDPAPAHVITGTVQARGHPAVMIPATQPGAWLDGHRH
jgi:hypothetical protein